MFELKVQAEDVPSLKKKLEALLFSMEKEESIQQELPLESESKPAPKEEKKPKAKKAKAVKPEEVATEDDVKSALTEVNTKLGLKAAKQILNDFGLTRISEVTPDIYGKFIQSCKDACGEAANV